MLTRTVLETAQLLDVLAGPEPGDASWAPPPAEPFAATAARPPGTLRIGVTTLAPIGDGELNPQCARAAHDAGELLASLGHEVEHVDAVVAARGDARLLHRRRSGRSSACRSRTRPRASVVHRERVTWSR